jgi:hypothetical protein
VIEIRTIKVQNTRQAPFSGTGIVAVIEQSAAEVYLFYPYTLETFMMPIEEKYEAGELVREGYKQCLIEKGQLWPVNETGLKFDQQVMAGTIRHKASESKEFQRSLTVGQLNCAATVVAFLEGKTKEIVLEEFTASTQTRTSVRKERSAAAPKEPKAPKIELKFRFVGDATKLSRKERLVAEAMLKLKSATRPEIFAEMLKGQLLDGWGPEAREPKAAAYYFPKHWTKDELKMSEIIDPNAA